MVFVDVSWLSPYGEDEVIVNIPKSTAILNPVQFCCQKPKCDPHKLDCAHARSRWSYFFQLVSTGGSQTDQLRRKSRGSFFLVNPQQKY